MKKLFYKAFGALYEAVAPGRHLTKKEDLYRLIFEHTGFGEVFSDDPIRKVTSGIRPIHERIVKSACTDDSFESLRFSVEEECLPYIDGWQGLTEKLLAILHSEASVPDTVKAAFEGSLGEYDAYRVSRFIAGALLCFGNVDRGGQMISDWGFVHLSASSARPRYITDRPNSGVDTLLGRERDLEDIGKAVLSDGKAMITGVGGIGKTELVKKFLAGLGEGSGVKQIAWVPYDNHDIRGSLKRALNLDCPADEIWMRVQGMAETAGKDLLLVVDNIEHADADEYLSKLGNLPCRLLVTSRQRKLPGFPDPIFIQPLEMDACRDLFYLHYQFEERDNAIVNDIIELTAHLTIMVTFIAKVAYVEEMTLIEVYNRLVEKGFKLSEEDVSSEHERLNDDAPIIKQMCILFTLVNYGRNDKAILTCASVIPSLQFDFGMAKKWFGVGKNSSLLKLYGMGMLEHAVKDRKHVYWMHSVIAAAVREQQKSVLYETASSFIHELSEELDFGDEWGKGYTKLELIPFSWSVADIFEGKWGSEEDADFLLRVYYVCFEASNYPLCRTLLEQVLEIDGKGDDLERLIRDNKNMSELLLRLNDVDGSVDSLKEVERLLGRHDPDHRHIRQWAYLWHNYGNIYYHAGMPVQALEYYEKARKLDEGMQNCPPRELATDYSSIAAVYQQMGELRKAYEMLEKAIEVDGDFEEDSETIMFYQYMGSICTDLFADGYTEYAEKAEEAYARAIAFREANSVKYSSDKADLYLEYSNYLYQVGNNRKAREFSEKAKMIYQHLYGEDCYPVLQCRANNALILAEEGRIEDAIAEYADIVEREGRMSNVSYSDYAKDCQNFAMLLETAERYGDSWFFWKKSEEILTRYFSKDTIRLAETLLGMANNCMGMEKYKEAIDYLEKLADIAKEERPKLRVALYKLGDCCANLEQYEQAIKYYDESLALCDETSLDDKVIVCVGMALVCRWNGNEEKYQAYSSMAREIAAEAEDDFITEYVHTLDTI